MAVAARVERGVAQSIARFLDTAVFDEGSAHLASLPDLSSWLGALIQAHLDDEPTWPVGWVIDDAAPGALERLDGSTVRVAGIAWILAEGGDVARQPFAGTVSISPGRNSLLAYKLSFGDAVIGVDSRASSERDQRDWPNVATWVYTFSRPDRTG